MESGPCLVRIGGYAAGSPEPRSHGVHPGGICGIAAVHYLVSGTQGAGFLLITTVASSIQQGKRDQVQTRWFTMPQLARELILVHLTKIVLTTPGISSNERPGFSRFAMMHGNEIAMT